MPANPCRVVDEHYNQDSVCQTASVKISLYSQELIQSMRTYFPILIFSFVVALMTASCSSTRVENGVIIQKERSYNLLDYLPIP